VNTAVKLQLQTLTSDFGVSKALYTLMSIVKLLWTFVADERFQVRFYANAIPIFFW